MCALFVFCINLNILSLPELRDGNFLTTYDSNRGLNFLLEMFENNWNTNLLKRRIKKTENEEFRNWAEKFLLKYQTQNKLTQ